MDEADDTVELGVADVEGEVLDVELLVILLTIELETELTIELTIELDVGPLLAEIGLTGVGFVLELSARRGSGSLTPIEQV